MSSNLQYTLVAELIQSGIQSAGPIIFTVDGVHPVSTLTSEELLKRSRAVAADLIEAFPARSRALIGLPTSPEFFAAFFGCVAADIIPVPIAAFQSQQALKRVEAIALECEASIFLTSEPLAQRVQALDGAFWSRTKTRPVIVSMEGEQQSPSRRPVRPPDEPAYLQFTSGSTGKPRGVMVSHANAIANLAAIDGKAGRPRTGAVVSWLPLYHDMGLISALYGLYTGLPLVMLTPGHFVQQPLRWLKAVSHYRGVYSGAPNFAYELCNGIDIPANDSMDLSSWQFAFCAAEMVRPATMRRFAQKFEPFGFRPDALSPAFGLAEFTLMVSAVAAETGADVRNLHSSSLNSGPISPALGESKAPTTEISECGMAGPGHKIIAVDLESRRSLPDGHIGEIWVTGPSKALGYWGRPDETRATFEAQPEDDPAKYLRTGDLGFTDAGRVYITGRIKELIVVRGRNFHPHEIEEAARDAHPAVRLASAFGVTTEDAESLILVCELRRTSLRTVPHTEVLTAVQNELVKRQDIRADVIGLVKPGNIPLTTSGKIQRLKYRNEYIAGHVPFLASWPPAQTAADLAIKATRSEIEDWIVQWLSLRLKVPAEKIDRRTPLSGYGLDSLAAVQLIQAIDEWLKIAIIETVAWSYPTVEELSRYLEQQLNPIDSGSSRQESRKSSASQVDSAFESIERMTEAEVDELFRNRIAKGR
jgi:acyl-CoA synthetase (AMP-forming)/AMP-acid ligase II/acyl carrier protein